MLLAMGAIGAALSTGAQAATLTGGPVTLSTIGTVTTGTPYASGQTISISVTANSTMDNASLVAAGFPSGAVAIKALECADPGGLVVNLPTKPSECDPNTIASISGANADGSMNFASYTVYALPDIVTFGEPTDATPVCDKGAACVVGLFSNYNDFSKPVIFSAPFFVAPNTDDGGENPGDGSAPAVTPVSPTDSMVTAGPATVTADGVDGANVTVTLEDTNGVPVTGGKQVTLAQGSGQSTISVGGVATTTATTDATTGVASFTVTDTTAQTVTYTATDTTDGVALAAQATVTFVAPVVTPSNSSITASPTQVTGGGTSTVTVTLDDQAVVPHPVAGKVVSLSDGSGHTTINAVNATTDGSGQATFLVTDSSTEVAVFTATDTTDGIALTGKSATITFGTLTVSASASTVTASPAVVSSAASGGVLPKGTITVTLLAADGSSPVAGKTVTLSASSATAQITPAATPDVTGPDGEATFEVADGTAEAVTFTATDTTDGLPITNTAVVTFAQPSASASSSVVTESASTGPADGVTSVAIAVTVKDQFGHPLAGKMVTVSGSPAATTRVAPQTESTSVPAGTTDATGSAVFFAYDTTAETVIYTASDSTDNVTLTQTVSVTYSATAPQADDSTVTAVPNSVPADGSTSSTVTVTLDDHNSNPVPGKAITLAANGGSSKITPIAPTTDSKGQATFGVTDSTAEVVMYTATDTTDGLVLVGEAVTVTFGTPPQVRPTVADSAVVAVPIQVRADGTTAATLTVVLADANGDALSGKTVAINPQGGGSTVTTVAGVTSADGEATFTVTDKTAETVTYDATDVTDSLPISGQSATVTFTAAGSSGSGSGESTTTTTSSVPGASSTSTPTATAATSSTSGTASTGTTGTGSSGASVSAPSSGGTLALTGSPRVLPWLIALGCVLLGLGTIGRLRLTGSTPVMSQRQVEP